MENGLNIESNNQLFNIKRFLSFQKLNRELLQTVADKVQLEMNYIDIENLILENFKVHQIDSSWHPIKVRIDTDTLLSFSQKSDPEIKIKQNSIFFIDIGTVKDGLEGDVGETFVFGDDFKKTLLIKKCKTVFDETIKAWKVENLTGPELYKFAQQKSLELNVELNLKMDGHRVGSFPHGVYFKGGLMDIEISPSPNLWILEIQIKCPMLNLGAFYEDLIQ